MDGTDPEVRVVIPLRSTMSVKVSEKNGTVYVRFGHFLASRVTFQFTDTKAIAKMQDALETAMEMMPARKPKKKASKR